MSKATLTMRISYEISERLRNTVYWTPGITMSDFMEQALIKSLEEREQENGGPFEQRDRLKKYKRHVN
jgi:hypothetical protein